MTQLATPAGLADPACRGLEEVGGGQLAGQDLRLFITQAELLPETAASLAQLGGPGRLNGPARATGGGAPAGFLLACGTARGLRVRRGYPGLRPRRPPWPRCRAG
jgi:hypothetical protein